MKYNKKKLMITGIILLITIGISIGYAYLSSVLNITGQSKIEKATWDVHFENVRITNGSVSAIKDATIDSNTTNLSYEIQLDQPGDFYEFTVDVKNAGSIDAMVSEVLKTGLTAEQTNYLSYTLTYSDGKEIMSKDKIESSEIKSIIVRLEFKKDITVEQLPSSSQELSLSLNITYIQADNTANIVVGSFSTDTWNMIVQNVKTGRISDYKLGDTKEVDMGDLGVHTVRVANTSTPETCETIGYSQTACGFVVEFTDIITTHNMNSATADYSIGHNIGGWSTSDLRVYMQNVIFPALPLDLQRGILDTTVVSSHGDQETKNFITTDKLYLLSPKEAFQKEGTNTVFDYDTSVDSTRQLDYYKSIGVTTSNYSETIKQYKGSPSYWWLRSAISTNNYGFYFVNVNGNWSGHGAYYDIGISPAFRIG